MYWREVVASLYPWDLLDEGLEAALDTLERETLANSTYLVALMHDEKRPLTDFYYPHNPKRKVYWTEDSRAYWRPNPDAYANSRIKPRTTCSSSTHVRTTKDPSGTCIGIGSLTPRTLQRMAPSSPSCQLWMTNET